MIVYVESNFIIELALEQEEVLSAQQILDLTTEGKIDLAIPSFSFSEPYDTILRRAKERKMVCTSLNGTLRQLQRSKPHKEVVARFAGVLPALIRVEQNEIESLETTVCSLLQVCRVLEFNYDSYQEALTYQTRYALSPQDSIILATVTADLKAQNGKEPKCFLSRNWKDFNDPGVKAELRTYNCVYLSKFEDGLSFIKKGNEPDFA